MKNFKISYQTLRDGKPLSSGVASVIINANSQSEARGKFQCQHPNGNVKILAVEEK